MSIPNQALEKLIREIESQAFAAQQQIGQARTQMTAKQREMRMIRLTLDEVTTLPLKSSVYEGVGKMAVERQERFVSMPNPKLTKKLEGQIREKEGEVEKLSQKLHYLETTFKNSRQHIDKMLKAQS